VPVGHVLVGDARSDVEHDDTALALNVVAVAQTAKLLLPCGVPDVEADRAEVGVESQWVNFDTKSGWDRVSALRGTENSLTVPMYFFSNSPVTY
jgi:hypothetical protein